MIVLGLLVAGVPVLLGALAWWVKQLVSNSNRGIERKLDHHHDETNTTLNVVVEQAQATQDRVQRLEGQMDNVLIPRQTEITRAMGIGNGVPLAAAVVDDDRAFGALVSVALAGTNIKTTPFADLGEVVGAFDVVLLDLDLPGSRGADTVTKARQMFGATPIVVMASDAAAAAPAIRAGADQFVAKDSMLGASARLTLLRMIDLVTGHDV